MAATSPKKYNMIKVTGPVSVERVSQISESDRDGGGFFAILIMGPTGAGKSTFIEALGLRNADKISSNRLEGFTQTVSTYRINNVVSRDSRVPIYLVDSPGFADTKISEMAIVSMLRQWMKDNGRSDFSRILYLTPITHVRLSGSQLRVLKTFRALTGLETGESIIIATTMWDAIKGEGARARAERTYEELESCVWKGFINKGAKMVKFYNTQGSALSILNEILNDGSQIYFHMEGPNRVYTDLRVTLFAANLYTDLQDRIQSQQLEIVTIQADLEYGQEQSNELLRSVLGSRLEEAQNLLQKFQEELQEFGPPPPGYHPPNAVPEPTPSSSVIAFSTLQVPYDAEGHIQPQAGRLSRALDLIMGCACCGKAVEANHDV